MAVAGFPHVLLPARYDGRTWTRVRIEESESPDGPWTVLETVTLARRSDTPDYPFLVGVSTSLATLNAGWYRLTLVDDSGGEHQLEAIAHNTSLDITPTVAEVAALLLERTYSMGTPLGTFTADTRPTEAQVATLCAQAAIDVKLRVGHDIPPSRRADARRLATLQAATLVEMTYFSTDDTTSRPEYAAMFISGVESLRDDLYAPLP